MRIEQCKILSRANIALSECQRSTFLTRVSATEHTWLYVYKWFQFDDTLRDVSCLKAVCFRKFRYLYAHRAGHQFSVIRIMFIRC